MSITATNYFINNSGSYVDLSNVFVINYPVSGTPATGYTTVDFPNTDLADIFEAQTTEPSIYITTNYIVENYTPLWSSSPGNYDLGQIFIPNNSYFFTTTGNPTITSGQINDSIGVIGTYSYIIIFTGNGTFTPISPSITTVNYLVIGGGGGGGTTVNNFTNYYYGGGGGGGQFDVSFFATPVSTTYTINVGLGGTLGGGNGGSSSITTTSGTIVTVAGGSGGGAGINESSGGVGGSSGSNTGGSGSIGSSSVNGYGGGGASQLDNGSSASSSAGGNGGTEFQVSFQGYSVTDWAGGGIGGNSASGAPQANSGYGGGNNGSPFAGADGIVILYF